MKNKKNIWLIADTHFGHEYMIKKGLRPKDFNERIMKNWSESVKEDEIVIHLGDILISNRRGWPFYIPQLPGRKILTVGNHDHENYRWYMNNGFDFVCEKFMWEIYGLKIIFSHEPLDNLCGCDINVHGHLHDGMHRGQSPTDNHVLISTERLNCQMVTLENVVNKWINR